MIRVPELLKLKKEKKKLCELSSAYSRFLGRVGIWMGQRKVSVLSVLRHLQKRLTATNRAQQHSEMCIYHSIYLRITKMYVIPR